MKSHWNPKCGMSVEHLCLVCQTAPSNELAVAFDVVVVVGNGADIHFAQSLWPADEFQKVALIFEKSKGLFSAAWHSLAWETGTATKSCQQFDLRTITLGMVAGFWHFVLVRLAARMLWPPWPPFHAHRVVWCCRIKGCNEIKHHCTLTVA